MAGKFEHYCDTSGKFRFRLKARNGENIASSDRYEARSGAINGIKAAVKSASNPGHFEVFEGKDKNWYFKLKVDNGRVIRSRGYQSRRGAHRGVRSFAYNAKYAKVSDS